MAGKVHCPECCGDCIIATDDFNRTDADDPGPNWTEIGDADYAISGNTLICVSENPHDKIIFNTTHPGGATAKRRIVVRFKLSGIDATVGVMPAYADPDNFTWVEILAGVDGCWGILISEFYQGSLPIPGALFQIMPEMTLNEWHTLEVCLHPGAGATVYYVPAGLVRVKVTLANGKVYGNQWDEARVESATVGLNTNSSSDEEVYDDFRFEWMGGESGEEHARCPKCRTGCVIEISTFTAGVPDSPEDDCKWDGNKLRVFHPELSVEQHVEATVEIVDGENAEVRINMLADESEYHWARASLSGTTLTFSIGKTGTTLATDTATFLGGSGTLVICADYTDGLLDANVNGLITLGEASEAIADGFYSGRGGTAEFVRFYYGKLDPACEQCGGPVSPCSADAHPACDGSAPQFFAITPTLIDDVPSGNPPPFIGVGVCNLLFTFERSCGSIGTVVLDVVPPAGSGICAGACQWVGAVTVQRCVTGAGANISSVIYFTLAMAYDESANETTITVRAQECDVPGTAPCCTASNPGLTRALWRLTLTGKQDCMALTTVLPLVMTNMDGQPVCYYDQWGSMLLRAL